MSRILVSASLLSSDHGALTAVAVEMEKAGADIIHLDVMDGVFVPVLTFGAGVAKSIIDRVSIPVEAHLMVAHPEVLIHAFADAGCERIIVHAETADCPDTLLRQIHKLGCRAGIALNPATSPDLIKSLIPMPETILLMTVNPGYGGQAHLKSVHPKITAVRKILEDAGADRTHISIDGGVDASNAPTLVSLGADTLVSGSRFGDVVKCVNL